MILTEKKDISRQKVFFDFFQFEIHLIRANYRYELLATYNQKMI